MRQASLSAKIDQLSAHVRRKPHDHSSMRKLTRLIAKRDGGHRYDAVLKAYYQPSAIEALSLARNPLFAMLKRSS